MANLLATKPMDVLLAESKEENEHSLKRALGPINLITLGIGAIIGAIVGGGKGAAIGAAIGGSVGTAGVLTKRGKDIRLDRGQQLKIRAATDTHTQ